MKQAGKSRFVSYIEAGFVTACFFHAGLCERFPMDKDSMNGRKSIFKRGIPQKRGARML